MENIKALIIFRSKKGMILSSNHNYEFEYSKTGSVKYRGKYKPKYFEKEKINSCNSIEIGNQLLFLFTEGFKVNENQCIKNQLKIFISNTEKEIKQKMEHFKWLNLELTKYSL